MATFRVLNGLTDPAPPTTSVNDATPITLGVEFTVSAPCTLTQIHYWQPSAGTISTASRTVALYTTTNGTTGTLVGSAETLTVSGSGWQTHTLATPKALTSGTVYTAAVFHPAGQYVASSLYFDTAGRTSGPVTFPSHNDSLSTNAKFTTAASLTFPASGFNHSNYWVDVTVTTEDVSPLTVNVGADTTTAVGTPTGTLTATAADGSGTKTYAWSVTSGPTGTFSAPTSASTTFTPATEGTSVLRCTVTDTSGSAFDELSVVATAAAPTPVRHIYTSGVYTGAYRHIYTGGAWVAVDPVVL